MPLSRIKRRTAANLGRAWLTIPLVTHFDETDVTDLEAFRRSLRDDPDARGARITLLAFAMKALVATLKEFPTFNASLAPDGGSLVLKRYYHLGIAVDTPEGLVVPVIRDVDRKRVTDLSFELAEVSGRARERKLRPDDVQGSCMTISSLGGHRRHRVHPHRQPRRRWRSSASPAPGRRRYGTGGSSRPGPCSRSRSPTTTGSSTGRKRPGSAAASACGSPTCGACCCEKAGPGRRPASRRRAPPAELKRRGQHRGPHQDRRSGPR